MAVAGEARIAATFGRVEEAVVPLLRSMQATGRTTYVTDPERSAIWGHAFLRPPYAPHPEAEWFLAWGLCFPDGGSGWDGADPPLPRGPQAIVALGACGEPELRPPSLLWGRLPAGWSVVDGGAASPVAALPLRELAAEPEEMVAAMAAWTLARLDEIRAVLPDLATHAT